MLLIVAAFSAETQAATPQETIKRYIADLQKNPNDTALWEKIIKHVQRMKPKPATPGEKVYEGIMLVRQGKLKIVPGYDGVYGQISIFPKEGEGEQAAEGKEQMSLF